MKEEENVQKNIKALEELAKEGRTFHLKICPQCKAIALSMMDVLGLYSPLSPVRFVCKKCGWVGRVAIELTNQRIDELDEKMLDDIIESLSEEDPGK